MEEDFRDAVAAALAAIISAEPDDRTGAEHFLNQMCDASRERRQRFLDVLLELALGADHTTSCVALLMMRKVAKLPQLRLDDLFDAFLNKDLRASHAAPLLARAVGEKKIRIPDDVVQRARESTRSLGLALWLASDAADVVTAVEKAMSGPVRQQSDLMPCLEQIARKYPEVIERMFRRSLAQGRDSLALDLQLLSQAGIWLHGACFSDSEWDVLCAASLEEIDGLWDCFADDARPDRLVDAMVQRAMAPDFDEPPSIVLSAWEWMSATQAEMLMSRFLEANDDGDGALATMASGPPASPHAREQMLLKMLHSSAFWSSLDSGGDADWKCYSNEQLDTFAELQTGLVLLPSFARELVARSIVLKPEWRHVLRDADMLAEMGRASLCCYALHDLSLFADLKVGPCADAEDKAREIVFSFAGHWSARRHRHLPRSVQQVALVTIWALKRRVGTRHIVYMILERALVAEPFDCCDSEYSHELFEAVLALLRR
jgi:hypothetical protein